MALAAVPGPAGPAEGTSYDPVGANGAVPSDRFADFVNGAQRMQKGSTYVMVDLRGFGGPSGCLDLGRPRDTAAPRSTVSPMAREAPRMISLGYGKHVRADRIFAIVPLEGHERGDGRRTLVWVEGLAEPMIASRSERAILADVEGSEAARRTRLPVLDQDALF